MIESELAFNQNGEPFAVPETATGWRVRRLRGGRGAPELVYAREGGPLVLAIDAGLDDLREAIGVSGRYRLDAIDDDGKAVTGLPPSYVQVTVDTRNASSPEETQPAGFGATEFAIRELTRANADMMRANAEMARQHTELAKTVATQQPELMRAAAEILRAADGAGMSRRDPYYDDYSDDDAQADDNESTEPTGLNMPAILGQLGPFFQRSGLLDPKKVAELGTMITQWLLSSSAPQQAQLPPAAPMAAAAPTTPAPRATRKPPQAEPAPFRAENIVAHLQAIEARLTPDERARVEHARASLNPSDMKQWLDQLASVPLDEAVTLLRAEIQKRATNPNAQEAVS